MTRSALRCTSAWGCMPADNLQSCQVPASTNRHPRAPQTSHSAQQFLQIVSMAKPTMVGQLFAFRSLSVELADGAAAKNSCTPDCLQAKDYYYQAGPQGRTQVTRFIKGMGGEFLSPPSRSSLRSSQASARCSRPDAARLLMLSRGMLNTAATCSARSVPGASTREMMASTFRLCATGSSSSSVSKKPSIYLQASVPQNP